MTLFALRGATLGKNLINRRTAALRASAVHMSERLFALFFGEGDATRALIFNHALITRTRVIRALKLHRPTHTTLQRLTQSTLSLYAVEQGGRGAPQYGEVTTTAPKTRPPLLLSDLITQEVTHR
jgi:hypothetical protein